jgi:hypothetical protein
MRVAACCLVQYLGSLKQDNSGMAGLDCHVGSSALWTVAADVRVPHAAVVFCGTLLFTSCRLPVNTCCAEAPPCCNVLRLPPAVGMRTCCLHLVQYLLRMVLDMPLLATFLLSLGCYMPLQYAYAILRALRWR